MSTGLRARLASQGITGLAYIELDFVDPAQYPVPAVPWTPTYEVIPSVPSTLAQVQDAAQTLLAQINAVDLVGLGHAAQRLLDDLHRQLAEGGDAQQALAGAAALMVTAREAVQRADLPGLAAELRGAAAGARALVSGPQGREALAAATRAADRLADAAAKLPALVTALQATVQRTSGDVADLQSGLIAAAARCPRGGRQPARDHRGAAPLSGRRAARRPAAAGERTMRRRALLAAPLALAGCGLETRPYAERRQWPLLVHRPQALPPRTGGPVLLVRSFTAGPGMEARGLQSVQPDGSIRTEFYEEWSVPPAQAVEEAVRSWLAQSGLFSAVLAPGSRLAADLVLEGELDALWTVPAENTARAALGLTLVAQERHRDAAGAAATGGGGGGIGGRRRRGMRWRR